MKRTLLWLLAGCLILVAGAELVARFGLGLGTPPLSQPHPHIEYLFQPDQDVSRFGNRVLINAYAMRTPDFAEVKPADEFRVMIFGDSVLNGGNLTDHAALATTLLSERLAEQRGQPVVVGNISAGSWGRETGWLTPRVRFLRCRCRRSSCSRVMMRLTIPPLSRLTRTPILNSVRPWPWWRGSRAICRDTCQPSCAPAPDRALQPPADPMLTRSSPGLGGSQGLSAACRSRSVAGVGRSAPRSRGACNRHRPAGLRDDPSACG